MSSREARVVVVGGGIAGLAAAYELARGARIGEPISVVLSEASARLGGHVRTIRERDLLLEAGPDSLVPRKPAALELCRELGLEPQLVAAPQRRPVAQVVWRGRLHDLPGGAALAMPTSPGDLLRSRLYSPFGRARMLVERFVPAAADESETLGAFVKRRLGREAFERAVEPVVGALFAGDASRFVASLAAPQLVEAERRWGSLTAATRHERRVVARPGDATASGAEANGRPPAQLAPRLGMEEIVRALERQLVAGEPRIAVETGAAVVRIRRDGDETPRGFVVEYERRETIRCESVILALPATTLRNVVRPLDEALADAAAGLSYASCGTVGVAYPREAVPRALRGLGVFASRAEGTPVLGASYASEKFAGRAPESLFLVRAFLGGALHESVLDRDDDELVELTHGALARWLGLAARPLWSRVDRHRDAIPQLVAGCEPALALLRGAPSRVPGLYIVGSALGLYGIADCVASGRAAAREALLALGESSS